VSDVDEKSADAARGHLVACDRCGGLDEALGRHTGSSSKTSGAEWRRPCGPASRDCASAAASRVGGVASAGLCLLLIGALGLVRKRPEVSDVVAKGGAQLTAFVRRGEDVRRIRDGDQLRQVVPCASGSTPVRRPIV
jgi:hypothetical protein